jgi:hypothetical protein
LLPLAFLTPLALGFNNVVGTMLTYWRKQATEKSLGQAEPIKPHMLIYTIGRAGIFFQVGLGVLSPAEEFQDIVLILGRYLRPERN